MDGVSQKPTFHKKENAMLPQKSPPQSLPPASGPINRLHKSLPPIRTPFMKMLLPPPLNSSKSVKPEKHPYRPVANQATPTAD